MIFQDLAIIAMVLLVPLLSGAGESGGSGFGILWDDEPPDHQVAWTRRRLAVVLRR